VVDVATGTPVLGAGVNLSDAAGIQVTDTSGGLRFDSVPPGSHLLSMQRLGYGTTADTLLLRPGERVRVRFRVAARPLALKPLVVEADRYSFQGALSQAMESRMGGFYTRQALGLGGKFFGPEQIRPLRFDPTLGDVLQALLIHFPGAARRLPGYSGAPAPSCPPLVYVDAVKGAPAPPPEEIAAIEAYTGAYIPGQFMGPGSDCGVLVVWSRWKQAATDTTERQ
jgi:Carboxypeptidase regulatory-like domain